MGMSASQTRFLMLTAQLSDNEYQAQQITWARLSLSQATQSASTAYNEAMSNRNLLFLPTDESSENLNLNSKLTYNDIVKAYSEGGLGMRLINKNGKIVVPGLPSTLYEGTTEEDYEFDPNIVRSKYLEQQLRDGEVYLQKRVEKDETNWKEVSFASVGNIYDELDKTDDTPAQAEYDTKMAQFQKQDKYLEMELDKLETEHEAIKTEMDSVKNVIKKNVENSFNTFV